MKKLLIVDDEPGVRSLVKMTLESQNYEILEASNGREALDQARQHHPELILLDVAMPQLSGLEVCREIKSDPAMSDVKILMLTARSQQSDEQGGVEAGADGYFTKPFSPISLLEKVDEILGLSQ
ncbi:MAG: response regulator transcription factor [Actinomycetota bacterium]